MKVFKSKYKKKETNSNTKFNASLKVGVSSSMQSRQSVSECVVKYNLHENNFVLRINQPRKNNVIVFLHELKIKKIVADGRMHN